MKFFFFTFCLLLLFASCKKNNENINDHDSSKIRDFASKINSTSFIKYTIQQGKQYCDQDTFVPVNYTELKFMAKFDSSAVYTSAAALNQLDVNKLYGFSDNNAEHHQFSARFGWRWNENELQIFGYTYNDGIRRSKELGTISLGTENNYVIKVSRNFYTFYLNNKSDTMIRTSTTPTAVGYKLYPYFGGDEVAPHFIDILISEAP